MKSLGIGAIGAMLLAAAPAQAATNLVTNGGFELGSDPGSFSTQGAGSTDITGWTVGGTVDYIGGYWKSNAGSDRSIDLVGSSVGSLSQTIATVAGQVYEISFFFSGNPAGGSFPKLGTAQFGSTAAHNISFSGPSSLDAMNWRRGSFFRTATTTGLTTITFAGLAQNSGGFYGLALDSVSVTATPEPEIYLSMLAGLGMAGFAARRRAKRAAKAMA